MGIRKRDTYELTAARPRRLGWLSRNNSEVNSPRYAMAITLPQKPDGDQYEDYVAAALRALGYFTETRLVLRDKQKEVLELDIVATPVAAGPSEQELFEAKREGINFPNVFKLFGQRMYLQIPSACLVSFKTVDPNHLPVYQSRGTEMGVRICHQPLDVDVANSLAPPRNAISDEERHAVVAAGWYQHIAKRLALAAFNKKAASKGAPPVCASVKEYLFGVYAGFFQPTALARAEALYSAWVATPKLSGEAVATIAADLGTTEKAVWNQVNDGHEHLWVQMVMHLETTARGRIIKNALDDLLVRGDAPPPSTTLQFGSLSLKIPLHALPQSFHQGLRALQQHPHGSRIPYLFQVYSELLGGFLAFNNAAELAFVERLTGVPASDVRPAIELVDRFFAPAGGTMLYTQKNELLCLKMTPGYVRGGGAFLRQSVFSLADYPAMYPEMGWLIGRWHDALYRVLEPALKTSSA